MATSGTITGSRGGSSTGPWLTLYWERVEEDVSNNRSRLYLRLRLHSDRSLYFSANKDGYLEGTSFTYTGNFSGTGYVTLYDKYIWVNHDADGTKTIWLNGDLDIGVNWSGSWVSNISVAGNAYLDAIPRASNLTAFSIDNPYLTVSSQRTVSYTVDKEHSGFTHDFYIKFDGRMLQSWSDSGEGVRSQTLWSTTINEIINEMPNRTGGWLTLEMQTKDGSNNIGNSVTQRDWVVVDGSVKPEVGQLNVSIYGTGRDFDIAKYVQNMSRVNYSFTTIESYGATIVSESVTIRRQSDNANSQVVNGSSGQTPNPVTLSGDYEVIAKATDSRGREGTYTVIIAVYPYSAPKINIFSTGRNATNTSNVNAAVDVTWSLASDNPTDITIVGVDNSNTSTTLYDLNGSTAGSLDTIQTYSGQSDASSYEYTITVTDSFGRTASAKSTIATTFVELTIAKGQGIGVGKVHERGALDVGGYAYFDKNAYFEENISLGGTVDAQFNPIYLGDGVNLNNLTTPGMYYSPSNASVATWLNAPGSKLSCSILVEKHAGIKQTYTEYNSGYANTFTRNLYNGNWGPWRTFIIDGPNYIDGINTYKFKNGYNLVTMRESGSPHNDPLLIQNVTAIINTNNSDQAYYDFSFPTAFNGDPLWIIAQPFNGSSSAYNAGVYNITNSGCRVYISHIADYVGTFYIDVNVIAAGKKI